MATKETMDWLEKKRAEGKAFPLQRMKDWDKISDAIKAERNQEKSEQENGNDALLKT